MDIIAAFEAVVVGSNPARRTKDSKPALWQVLSFSASRSDVLHLQNREMGLRAIPYPVAENMI
jgi:hypothetical protein